jgi:N-acetylmuramoyl-L-alanine amidase
MVNESADAGSGQPAGPATFSAAARIHCLQQPFFVNLARTLFAMGPIRRPVRSQEQVPEFRVVLDPGHGGRYEPPGKTTGDHWDPLSREFLLQFNVGAARGGLVEHVWVLETARQTAKLLAQTRTAEGFASFSLLLEDHGLATPASRAIINGYLTRTQSYTDELDPDPRNVNQKYRLFDSPLFPATGTEPLDGGRVLPGRISRINLNAPDLVVCLHNNGNPSPKARGFASVIVPPFGFFSTIHAALAFAGRAPTSTALRLTPRHSGQVKRASQKYFRGLQHDTVKRMISDTFTYFLGVRAFSLKNIGRRYLMVSWPYRVESPLLSTLLFFLRESSLNEQYRRHDGPEGMGGDNFFASQELLRYTRHALWRDYLRNPTAYLAWWGKTPPAAAARTPDVIVGPVRPPMISDWAVPLYVDSVVAFLELGFVTNPIDRTLLRHKQRLIAESLAVGIYSLCVGGRPAPVPGIEAPRGVPLDLDRYQFGSFLPGFIAAWFPPWTFLNPLLYPA